MFYYAQALDIMVAPEYQGKGVFRALAEFAVAQISLHQPVALWVMANERADGAHVQGLGWKRINVLVSYDCDTPVFGSPLRKFDLEECQSLDEATLSVIMPKRKPPLISTERSPEFLNWRLARNPWYSYSMFVVRRQGQPLGYMALKVFRDLQTRQTFGDIVDLCWAEDDPNMLAEMLRFALAYFRGQGINKATTWLQTNTVLDQVGREVGFVETPQKRYFCCKVLDERYSWLEDPSRWFITMADSEVY
jgi:hypothetical protein